MTRRARQLVPNWLLAFSTLLTTCLSGALSAQVFEKHSYNIAAQPVSEALLELALERDLNLVYVAALTKKIQSQPLQGEYTIAEALDTMLNETGLRATVSNSRMIKIELAPKKPQRPRLILQPRQDIKPKEPATPPPEEPEEDAIEEIVVVAQLISPYNLGTTVSSTKTQRDFLSTPQIVNALPASLSRDISARDYSEATQLASSVNFLERSAGVVEELRLRGFAYPSLKTNGIGAHAYIKPVDVAFIDSIEIAKGPGSVLFGRMEPGGVVNMMLKSPWQTYDELAPSQLTLRYGTDDFQRVELDVSADLSDSTSVRGVVFAQRYGEEAALDLDDAQGVMLALAHRLDNGSEFNIHYRYESMDVLQRFGRPREGFDNSVDVFITDDDEIEFVPSRQSDLRSALDESRQTLYVSLNDWLLGDWSADAYLQYDEYKANSNLNFPVIENFELEIDGTLVDSDELTIALLEDDEFLNAVLEGLEAIVIDETDISFENDPFAFDTRFFSAEFTAYNSYIFNNDSWLAGAEFEQLYGVNINYSEPETLIWQTHDTRSSFIPINQAELLFNSEELSNNVKDFNTGIFSQWVLSWQDFTAFVGARFDYLDFSAQREGVDSSADFLENTFRFGGIYRVTDTSSLFFNYSESFTPQFGLQELFFADRVDEDNEDGSIVVLNFADPAESRQLELGFKKSFFDGRLQSSCALFDIEKAGILADILRQRSRGAECDLAGSINRKWNITAGLSHLNAEIIESELPDFTGKRPRMTPENSVRIWITRDLGQFGNWYPRMGLGFRHIGERYIDSENEELLPAYNLLDLGLFTDYADNTSFTLFLRNVFDEQFVEGAFNAVPAWTTQGQERTLEANLSYRF